MGSCTVWTSGFTSAGIVGFTAVVISFTSGAIGFSSCFVMVDISGWGVSSSLPSSSSSVC